MLGKTYQPPNNQDYDDLTYQLIHLCMDRLIDLGSRLEAHSDVLATHERDEETGEVTTVPDVHPLTLLKAQLGLDGAEDEVEASQSLLQLLSRLLIIRRARNLIHQTHFSSDAIQTPPGFSEHGATVSFSCPINANHGQGKHSATD